MRERAVELGHGRAEYVRSGTRVTHGKFVTPLGSTQEGPDGLRLVGDEVIVCGNDRRIEVEHLVHRDEREIVHRIVLDGRILDGPPLIHPHSVEQLGLEAAHLVVHGIRHQFDLGIVTTVGLNHPLDGSLLDRHVPGGVRATLHALGARDPILLAAHDAARVVLDDGGYRCDGNGRGGGEVVGNVVLVAHAHLGLTRADDGISGTLGWLDNLDLKARVGKVPLVLGDVDARMVGVGRVVQTEADLGRLLGGAIV